jgi:hypothetical protein
MEEYNAARKESCKQQATRHTNRPNSLQDSSQGVEGGKGVLSTPSNRCPPQTEEKNKILNQQVFTTTY